VTVEFRSMKRRPIMRMSGADRATRGLAAAVAAVTLFGMAGGIAYAGSFALGVSRTSNVTLSDPNNWTTILTIPISSSAHGHACQAVASLDAANPGNNATTQTYFFTVTLDNANPTLNANGVQRRIELRDNSGVNDPDVWPVSTNSVFGLTANAGHTLRLLGRRAFGAPNLTVDDAVLSIICVG
jgi:hypothetical protein